MPGELLGARKEHIGWENKQIVGAGLKTETRRTKPIILADFIIPVLADLCDHTPNDRLIQINKDNFYTVYYKTLERAGVRRLTPYSCRHTAASTLEEENIQPSIIQSIMRHAHFSSTERYIHINTKSMHEAVLQIARVQYEIKNVRPGILPPERTIQKTNHHTTIGAFCAFMIADLPRKGKEKMNRLFSVYVCFSPWVIQL